MTGSAPRRRPTARRMRARRASSTVAASGDVAAGDERRRIRAAGGGEGGLNVRHLDDGAPADIDRAQEGDGYIRGSYGCEGCEGCGVRGCEVPHAPPKPLFARGCICSMPSSSCVVGVGERYASWKLDGVAEQFLDGAESAPCCRWVANECRSNVRTDSEACAAATD